VCAVGKQRELHHQEATFALASVRGWVGTNDHEPLHRASFPEFLLRRLVRMLIKARIPYPCEVPLVWLPLDRIAREFFLLVFQREQILENIHHRFLPGQAALAIEQKVAKY
jgi:hypothetical protein